MHICAKRAYKWLRLNMSTKADPDWLVVVVPVLSLYWNFVCRQDDTEVIAVLLPLPARCCDYQYTTTLEILCFLILPGRHTHLPTTQVSIPTPVDYIILHGTAVLSSKCTLFQYSAAFSGVDGSLPFISRVPFVIVQAIQCTASKFIAWRSRQDYDMLHIW